MEAIGNNGMAVILSLTQLNNRSKYPTYGKTREGRKGKKESNRREKRSEGRVGEAANTWRGRGEESRGQDRIRLQIFLK